MWIEEWELKNQDVLEARYQARDGYVRRIICGGCGRIFYTTSDTKKYCRSYICGNIANVRREREKRERARKGIKCKYCGKAFDAKRKDVKYCSNSCRQKAYRKRNETDPASFHFENLQ